MVALLDRKYAWAAPGAIAPRLFSYAFIEGRPLTTRGGWINPLVRAFLGLLCRRASPPKVRNPIYIAGLGRSGTTALGRVLSVHPEVGYLNEPKLAWNVIHPNEDVIGNYSRGAAKYALGRSDATPRVIDRAERIFGHYLGRVRRKRLVEKYPEAIFRTEFIRAIFPGARFLCLVRSPDDAITSIAEWSKRFGVIDSEERHNWWGVDDRKWGLFCRDILKRDASFQSVFRFLRQMRYCEDRAALEWVATTRAALQVVRDNPERSLLVRYETWATQPRETTAHILDWAGLSPDPVTLDYASTSTHPPVSRAPATLHPLVRELVLITQAKLARAETFSCE
jgi:hypothetical protein